MDGKTQINKNDLIKQLNLVEHIEGGYFSRTYTSPFQINNRALMTSIFYLLTNDRPIGHFHLNKSDILHFFQAGSPIKYLTISPEGKLETFKLGYDLSQGQELQKLVEGGWWKASVLEQGEFGLISEIVSPGFDYADMTIGTYELLSRQFPQLIKQIEKYIKK